MKRRIYSMILSGLLIFTLIGTAGCGSKEAENVPEGDSVSEGAKTESQDKEASKILNIGLINDPPTFSPLFKNSEYLDLLFLPLVEIDDDLSYKNLLAEEITTEDNQTFKVKILDNLTWTDGTPVTADDVLFTIGLFTSKDVASSFTSAFNILEGTDENGYSTSADGTITGARKAADNVVELKTKVPTALSTLQGSVGIKLRTLPKHILEGEDYSSLQENEFFQNPSVSDGPFKFVEHATNQYVKFVPNDKYVKGVSPLDELYFRITISSQVTTQLETGEIDMTDSESSPPVEDYARIRENENLAATSENSINANQILFINNEVIPDARVRKAINLAIDRSLIVDGLLGGEGEAAETVYIKESPYYNKAYEKSSYNPEEAKRLLEEAGWDFNKVIKFTIPTGNSVREQAGEIVASNLEAVGIKTEIQKVDFATSLADARAHKFELTIVGPGVNPMDPNFTNILSSSGSFNLGLYKNEEVDKLLLDGINAITEEEKIEAYHKIQDIIMEEVPCTALYQLKNLNVTSKRVTEGKSKSFGMYIGAYLWDVE